MVLGEQTLAELLEGSLQHFEPAAILLPQTLFAAEHEQRSAALRARFGERQLTGIENEGGKRGT